jgi:hypothetical protein
MEMPATADNKSETALFSQKWTSVQRENGRWKCLQSREEFAKKFGTADKIIIQYAPIDDIRHRERWNVHVKYNLLGLFPLCRVTFGTNLSRKEVVFAEKVCLPMHINIHTKSVFAEKVCLPMHINIHTKSVFAEKVCLPMHINIHTKSVFADAH